MPVFNTNTSLITVEALAEPGELTWLVVEKSVDGEPVIQFERLYHELSAHVATTFLVVPRSGPRGRFLPVKEPVGPGRDAAAAARAARRSADGGLGSTCPGRAPAATRGRRNPRMPTSCGRPGSPCGLPSGPNTALSAEGRRRLSTTRQPGPRRHEGGTKAARSGHGCILGSDGCSSSTSCSRAGVASAAGSATRCATPALRRLVRCGAAVVRALRRARAVARPPLRRVQRPAARVRERPGGGRLRRPGAGLRDRRGRSAGAATSPLSPPRSSSTRCRGRRSTCSPSSRATATAGSRAGMFRRRRSPPSCRRAWSIPVAAAAAAPVRESQRQRDLPRAERRQNVARAFSARGSAPGRVCLVDDVYTTGSTATACATALRRAGARRVEVVCLARAVR